MKSTYFSKLVLVFSLSVPWAMVRVDSALCPTNKIAPRRRVSRDWDRGCHGRTLGAFYDLLAPGHINQGYEPSLQEVPQRDELDDCGDIEDYDEHDLSSLTPNYLRGDKYKAELGRFFFGFLNRPQKPTYPNNGGQFIPQNRPQQPQYLQNNHQQPPQRPNRPPYSSGGYFENNPYRPPTYHNPSDELKPVHEGGVTEPHTTYRPNLVGGPSGHVVGVSPVSLQYRPRPTRQPQYQADSNHEQYTTRRPDYYTYTTRRSEYDSYTTESQYYEQYTTQRPNHERYPQTATSYTFPNRPSRPRQMNYGNSNNNILGSFLDLFLSK